MTAVATLVWLALALVFLTGAGVGYLIGKRKRK